MVIVIVEKSILNTTLSFLIKQKTKKNITTIRGTKKTIIASQGGY